MAREPQDYTCTKCFSKFTTDAKPKHSQLYMGMKKLKCPSCGQKSYIPLGETAGIATWVVFFAWLALLVLGYWSLGGYEEYAARKGMESHPIGPLQYVKLMWLWELLLVYIGLAAFKDRALKTALRARATDTTT